MKSNDPIHIKIETLRTIAKLTQNEFGGLIGIDQTYVSKIEKGLVKMQDIHLIRICKMIMLTKDVFDKLEAIELASHFIIRCRGKFIVDPSLQLKEQIYFA